MNYNPYAAPQAAPPPYGGPPAYGAGAQPWAIGEVLSAAFEAFKTSWPVILGSWLVFVLCISPFIAVPIVLQVTGALDQTLLLVVRFAFNIVTALVEAFLFGGLYRIQLAIVRGQPASVGDLFSGGNVFASMFGVIFLTGVLFIFGCCIGGIVLFGMGLCFVHFFVADQNLGPIEAFKASWQATEGQRGEVFLYCLAAFGLYLAGAICCGVGALITGPVAGLGMAIIYLRLTGRGAPALGVGGGGPGYGPPGGGPGYGPPPGGGYGPGPGGYGPPGGGGPGGYGGPGGGGPGGYGGPGPGGYGPPGGGGGYGGGGPQY
jgi:hypothetical protein